MFKDIGAVNRLLINMSGRDVTVTHYTRSSGTSPGQTQSITTTVSTIRAVQVANNDAHLAGTKVFATDRKYIMDISSLTFVPEEEDLITDGGVGYKIIMVESVSPGDVNLAGIIYARRQ